MGRHMHRVADAAEDIGIRMIVSPYVTDLPPFDYFESFEDNDRLVQERNNSAGGRVKVWYGIELLPYSTPELYKRARAGATKHGVGIHLHANCEIGEVTYSNETYGKPPIDLFNDWGVLGPDVVIGHGVVLTEREICLLAEHGSSVIHCPQTGMKVALGIAPVPELRQAGVTVGLGTDGTAENGRLDMIETLKFAALLQKLNTMDPTVLPADETLELATLGGAKALGLEDEIGSLEVGKKADIVIVDRSSLRMTPIHTGQYDNTVTSIVYSATADDVDTVIIDGTIVLEDGRLTSISEDEIRERATEVGRDLMRRREPFVEARDRELDVVF
jgi:5-methylthioadenosine/S-adenosylhomocysteine deaminase